MEEVDWLLGEGEDLDGLRREHVSYGNLEYVFEEQLRDDTRELRIWQDDKIVAATTYLGDEIPEDWTVRAMRLTTSTGSLWRTSSRAATTRSTSTA